MTLREQKEKIIYLVYWDNYGDQGVDPVGIFSTEKKAQKYIDKQGKNSNDFRIIDFILNQGRKIYD